MKETVEHYLTFNLTENGPSSGTGSSVLTYLYSLRLVHAQCMLYRSLEIVFTHILTYATHVSLPSKLLLRICSLNGNAGASRT